MSKKSIVILILSILGVIVLGIVTWLIVSNWSAIKSGINGQKLFTENQVETIAKENYTKGENVGLKYKQELDKCINELEILKNKNNVQANEILELTSKVGSMKGQIEALQQANALKESEVAELNTEIEELRVQLLGIFSEKFNAGFNEGVESVDVNGIYERAYDDGYNAGYRKQEKIYTEQQANINVVWDGSIDTIWFTSDKSSENSTYDSVTDTYLIYKPSQLAGLSKLSSEGENFKNINISIINNLYFNNSNIDVLNYDTLTNEKKSSVNKFSTITNFEGNFYGNGHVISGLCVIDSNSEYVGMFGEVLNSNLRDFRIENSYFSGSNSVGALAGYLVGDKSIPVLVRNIEIEAKVQGFKYVGGMIGRMLNTTCENIYVTSNVLGCHNVGGLLGVMSNSKINNIYVNSQVQGLESDTLLLYVFPYRCIGGLVGYSRCNDVGFNVNVNTKILGPKNIVNDYDHFRFYGGIFGLSISNIKYENINNDKNPIKVYADLPTVDDSHFVVSCVGAFEVNGVIEYKGRQIPLRYNSSVENAGYVIFESPSNLSYDACYYDMKIEKDESITSAKVPEHNYVQTEKEDATVTTEGYIKYRCKCCGAEQTEILETVPVNYTVEYFPNVPSSATGEVQGSMTSSNHINKIKSNLKYNEYILNGYSFKCWNTKADGTGENYSDGQEIYNLTLIEGAIIQLYAQWENCFVFTGLNVNGEVTTNESEIVSYMLGNNSTSSSNGYTGTESQVVIPARYNNKPVTEIGTNAFGGTAFKQNTLIVSVVIPNSVIKINNNAFAYCKNLNSVNIPTNLITIGKSVFIGCKNITSVTLPNTLISIDNNAFSATGLESVVIPDSVVRLGESVFSGCSNLKQVQLSNSLTEIKALLFHSCSKLNAIEIPNGITTIGDGAFYETGLTKIVFSSSLNGIGSYSFKNCSQLTEVTFNSVLESLAMDSFENCANVKTIYVNTNNFHVNTINALSSVDTIVVKETFVSEFPINMYSGLVSYNVGGTWMFNGEVASSLKEAGTYYIGEIRNVLKASDIEFTVSGTELTILKINTNEKYYTIPDTIEINGITYEVVAIGNGINSVDSDVVSVVISEGVREIKSQAFKDCASLKNIVMPSSLTNIGDDAFSGCTSLLTMRFKGTTVPEMGSSIIENCTAITNIYVPTGTKSAYTTALGEKYETKIVERG